MRRCLIFLTTLLLLLLVVSALAQENGGVAWKPQFAYAFFIPEDGDIVSRPMAEIGLTYLLPLTENGEHNLKVGGLGGGRSRALRRRQPVADAERRHRSGVWDHIGG